MLQCEHGEGTFPTSNEWAAPFPFFLAIGRGPFELAVIQIERIQFVGAAIDQHYEAVAKSLLPHAGASDVYGQRVGPCGKTLSRRFSTDAMGGSSPPLAYVARRSVDAGAKTFGLISALSIQLAI